MAVASRAGLLLGTSWTSSWYAPKALKQLLKQRSIRELAVSLRGMWGLESKGLGKTRRRSLVPNSFGLGGVFLPPGSAAVGPPFGSRLVGDALWSSEGLGGGGAGAVLLAAHKCITIFKDE